MPSQHRITILDVAREAGVSTATVSRVLNQRQGEIKISETTKKRVLEAVERLGYQRNPLASALRLDRTGIIGAITRDINAVFLSRMARELQHVAHQRGTELLIGHAERDMDTINRQLSVMYSHWFDGLILIGDLPEAYQAVIHNLERDVKPFVSVACGPQASPPFVNVDEASGVRLALDYLYNFGHRRIAYIGNQERAGVRDRLTHFKGYIQEKQLFWTEDYLQLAPITRRDAVDCVQNLLRLPTPPTAIFCATDLQAIGAISGAWQIGWRVPEQISIIGFDGIEEAADVSPALTTVRQPFETMAVEALQLLMGMIADPSEDKLQKRIIVQPELTIRQSCAPPAT